MPITIPPLDERRYKQFLNEGAGASRRTPPSGPTLARATPAAPLLELVLLFCTKAFSTAPIRCRSATAASFCNCWAAAVCGAAGQRHCYFQQQRWQHAADAQRRAGITRRPRCRSAPYTAWTCCRYRRRCI